MLKVVLHFTLKKNPVYRDFELCQNVNYWGEIFLAMCVSLAKFLWNRCLSKTQYAAACFCGSLTLVNLIAFLENHLSDIFILKGIFSVKSNVATEGSTAASSLGFQPCEF